MNGHISQDVIDEVRNRVNIVDIVSEHVALKKAGRNFVGICPFHKEKTPSFTVNADKQIFYCFGCHEGGNVITFVMKINTMSFPDAVNALARKAGVVIPVRPASPKERKETGEREKLIKINGMALDFFSKTLLSPQGEKARMYLKGRGIEAPVVDRFRLGYAPDEWRELRRLFERSGVPLALAEKAGLLVRRDNGEYYDRFRSRIMFPIHDLNGNVVAFGGRIVGDGEPKYLNSPETPVYTKGKTLYGLNITRDEVRKKDCAVIVEGYFDFLALWLAGAANVVASLGTALTREQVSLIRRFTRNITLIFDPDEAGQHAVERSLQLFLEESMHASVVVLPGDYDPADYAARFGREGVEAALGKASSMVDYYIDHVIGGGETLERDADAAKNAVLFMAAIRDSVQRNLFAKRVSERLGIDQGFLKEEVRRVLSERKDPGSGHDRPPTKEVAVDAVEMALIHLMLEHPEKIPLVEEEDILSLFTDPALKELGGVLLRERPNPSDAVNNLLDGPLKERLFALLTEGDVYGEDVIDKVFRDTMKRVREKWFKHRHRLLKTRIQRAQAAGDTELCGRLLEEKESLLREERSASSARGPQLSHEERP